MPGAAWCHPTSPLGVTQVLKIIRYTCKLLLATALRDSSSEASIRLKEFEASIGTSRRACGLWFCRQRAVYAAYLKGRS